MAKHPEAVFLIWTSTHGGSVARWADEEFRIIPTTAAEQPDATRFLVTHCGVFVGKSRTDRGAKRIALNIAKEHQANG
jgi:hypothetical protein